MILNNKVSDDVTLAGSNGKLYALNRAGAYNLTKSLISTDFASSVGKLFTNPADYIISLRVYPFSVANPGGDVDIIIAGYTVPDAKGRVWSSSPPGTAYTESQLIYNIDGGSVTVAPSHLPVSDVRNYPPYTHLQFWVPFVGFVDADPSLALGKSVHLRYQIDYNTGDSVYSIYTGTIDNATIISTGPVKLGVDVPLGNNNAVQSALNTAISGISGIISTAVSAAAGYASGGVVGALAGGAGSAVASAGGVINAAHVNGAAGRCGGGMGDWLSCCYFTAVITSIRADIPAGYGHIYGRPLMQTRTLSNLTGYTQIADVHPEGIPCTAAELDQIVNALRDGIII